MPSRTIHLRLDDWALLGCHDILQMNKRSSENIPMATVVRQVINALVRAYQNSETIPTYTDEERIERAMELYGGALELELPFDPADLLTPGESVSDEDILDIVREAQQKIEESDAPKGIAREVEIADAIDTLPPGNPPKVNLFSQLCTSFSVHQKLSPKDRFIEWADNQGDLAKQAVAICYTGLPSALWGTDKAEEMIGDLLKNHLDDEAQDGNS